MKGWSRSTARQEHAAIVLSRNGPAPFPPAAAFAVFVSACR